MTAVAAGAAIEVLDEAIQLTPAVESIDFVGPGVTASNVGNAVTVTVNAVPTSPGGVDTNIQFNDGGSFGGFGAWDGSVLTIPGGITVNSTTEGILFPRLTTVQRNALTDVEGLVVYDTDDDTLYQNDGSVWAIPGAGQTTLQGAYDNDPTGAQILLDATPNPFTVQAAVAGTVVSWLDIAGNPIFTVTADPDTAVLNASLQIVDSFNNAGAANDLLMSNTYTQTGAFIGGPILSNGTVTTAVSTTWIWALLQESKLYRIGINPAFAAFTLFNALAAIENFGNFNLVQALVLNNGVTHRRITAGTSTTAQCIGVSNSMSTRTQIAGAVMTKTVGDTGLVHTSGFSTVAGSTVNLGTSRGVHFRNPAVVLFGSQAGVENATALIGLEVDALPFGGNIVKAAVRSAIAFASNSYFLLNNSNAQSQFGTGGAHWNDGTPIQFGGTAYNSQDVSIFWQAAGYLSMFFTSNNDDLRFSCPAANRFLIDNAGGNTDGEYNFNCAKFSMGAQTGAVGNQVGNFVAGARTVTVGGEWSDFLLTQAANITVDAAMGLVAGWTINAPSITLGTGSVTTAAALNIGGNPGSATNRIGLRILSNPSGGGGINAALWLTAGRARFDGPVDINNPIALGGGASATLGTIGGSGPTVAAQNEWVQIEVNGNTRWIPAWA